MKEMESKSGNELVFSGVQPTGNLHLGNYLGQSRIGLIFKIQKNVFFVLSTFMQSLFLRIEIS